MTFQYSRLIGVSHQSWSTTQRESGITAPRSGPLVIRAGAPWGSSSTVSSGAGWISLVKPCSSRLGDVALGGHPGGDQGRRQADRDLLAVPLLQPLQRGLHLLGGGVPAHPQSQLAAAGALQLGDLD